MAARARARAAIAAANQAGTVTVSQILDGHVTLEVECLDRVYLNAYVPNLQVGGQVVRFLTEHLGNPIPSPALFGPIGERFGRAVARFATANAIPVVRFDKDQRKAEVMRPTWRPLPTTATPRWSRSGWRRSSSGSSPGMTGAAAMAGRVRPGMGLRRPTGGSAATTSPSGTSSSARGSSSCAATSPGRPRCGSTATSGQAAGPPARHRVQRAGRRVRRLRRPGSVVAGVRPARPHPAPGVLRPLDGPHPTRLAPPTGPADRSRSLYVVDRHSCAH